MKTINPINLVLVVGIFLAFPTKIYSQTTQPKTETTMETPKKSDESQQIFIDRFVVPEKARQEFAERMSINRNFIKNQPGFIEDTVYERYDQEGNLICVTVAVWANEEAIKKARAAVQTEYQKQGFNIQAMLERLHITMDRGVYTKAKY